MIIKDAAKILNITGKVTKEEIKKAYRLACKKYHPDLNSAGLEMMQLVNAAYDELKSFEGSIGNDDVIFEESEYSEEINNALNAIIHYDDLEIEICGSWVWVGGNTRDHKETLKMSGFKWANRKKMWNFRPDDWKSSSRGNYSMDNIRDSHGSKTVKSKPRVAIGK